MIRGHMDTDAALTRVIPIMGMRAAPHLDFAGEVRAATRFPVFHAARIQDVATARHAIVSGKLDMVGMTRAHIAEPHIARLLAEGRETEIRPCVGATYCLDRIYEGNDAVCVHNAATGREATMPHVVARTEAAADERSSWSAPVRAGWKRPASPRRVAMRWRCSRRRRNPAARSCSPAAWRGARS